MKEHHWKHEGHSRRGDRALYGERSCLWSSCGDSELLIQPVQGLCRWAWQCLQLGSRTLRLLPRRCLRVCNVLSKFSLGSSLGQCSGKLHVCQGQRLWAPRHQKAGNPGPAVGLHSKLKGWSWSWVAQGVWQQRQLAGCPVPCPACCLGALFSTGSSNRARLKVILCQSTNPKCFTVVQRGNSKYRRCGTGSSDGELSWLSVLEWPCGCHPEWVAYGWTHVPACCSAAKWLTVMAVLS